MDADPVPVVAVDFQELTDHLHRELEGDVVHYVEGAEIESAIEEVVHELGDVVAQLPDDESLERLGHKTSQPRVFRWVVVE